MLKDIIYDTIEWQFYINSLFYRCTIVPYIDLNLSMYKIIEFTLQPFYNAQSLGLSQTVTTKEKPLKLAEMVPDVL